MIGLHLIGSCIKGLSNPGYFLKSYSYYKGEIMHIFSKLDKHLPKVFPGHNYFYSTIFFFLPVSTNPVGL